mmetsp:Transcript_28109/g.43454  ORF Transcript_28109/g.43454 Transcript_28109/m.43454 type:complete len:220 (-) Transcript_28109:25-684(-)
MSSPSSKQTAKQLNAYAIFLILERQRNLKLRELYRNKQVIDTPLLPVISEEESSASTTTTTTSAATRTSSLCQAMKMKKKSEATSSSSCMSTLPKFPPRYQALASIITSDVLMMQLRTTTPTSPRGSRQQRSPSSSHPTTSSSYLEEYKNLDQSTKRFLNDTVKIIQDRCNEEVENNETKLEIIDVRRRSSSRRTKAKVVGSKKLFVFRVEKKLSLIVD